MTSRYTNGISYYIKFDMVGEGVWKLCDEAGNFLSPDESPYSFIGICQAPLGSIYQNDIMVMKNGVEVGLYHEDITGYTKFNFNEDDNLILRGFTSTITDTPFNLVRDVNTHYGIRVINPLPGLKIEDTFVIFNASLGGLYIPPDFPLVASNITSEFSIYDVNLRNLTASPENLYFYITYASRYSSWCFCKQDGTLYQDSELNVFRDSRDIGLRMRQLATSYQGISMVKADGESISTPRILYRVSVNSVDQPMGSRMYAGENSDPSWRRMVNMTFPNMKYVEDLQDITISGQVNQTFGDDGYGDENGNLVSLSQKKFYKITIKNSSAGNLRSAFVATEMGNSSTFLEPEDITKRIMNSRNNTLEKIFYNKNYFYIAYRAQPHGKWFFCKNDGNPYFDEELLDLIDVGGFCLTRDISMDFFDGLELKSLGGVFKYKGGPSLGTASTIEYQFSSDLSGLGISYSSTVSLMNFAETTLEPSEYYKVVLKNIGVDILQDSFDLNSMGPSPTDTSISPKRNITKSIFMVKDGDVESIFGIDDYFYLCYSSVYGKWCFCKPNGFLYSDENLKDILDIENNSIDSETAARMYQGFDKDSGSYLRYRSIKPDQVWSQADIITRGSLIIDSTTPTQVNSGSGFGDGSENNQAKTLSKDEYYKITVTSLDNTSTLMSRFKASFGGDSKTNLSPQIDPGTGDSENEPDDITKEFFRGVIDVTTIKKDNFYFLNYRGRWSFCKPNGDFYANGDLEDIKDGGENSMTSEISRKMYRGLVAQASEYFIPYFSSWNLSNGPSNEMRESLGSYSRPSTDLNIDPDSLLQKSGDDGYGDSNGNVYPFIKTKYYKITIKDIGGLFRNTLMATEMGDNRYYARDVTLEIIESTSYKADIYEGGNYFFLTFSTTYNRWVYSKSTGDLHTISDLDDSISPGEAANVYGGFDNSEAINSRGGKDTHYPLPSILNGEVIAPNILQQTSSSGDGFGKADGTLYPLDVSKYYMIKINETPGQSYRSTFTAEEMGISKTYIPPKDITLQIIESSNISAQGSLFTPENWYYLTYSDTYAKWSYCKPDGTLYQSADHSANITMTEEIGAKIYGGFSIQSPLSLISNTSPVKTYAFGSVPGPGQILASDPTQKSSNSGYGDGNGGIQTFNQTKYYKITIKPIFLGSKMESVLIAIIEGSSKTYTAPVIPPTVAEDITLKLMTPGINPSNIIKVSNYYYLTFKLTDPSDPSSGGIWNFCGGNGELFTDSQLIGIKDSSNAPMPTQYYIGGIYSGFDIGASVKLNIFNIAAGTKWSDGLVIQDINIGISGGSGTSIDSAYLNQLSDNGTVGYGDDSGNLKPLDSNKYYKITIKSNTGSMMNMLTATEMGDSITNPHIPEDITGKIVGTAGGPNGTIMKKGNYFFLAFGPNQWRYYKKDEDRPYDRYDELGNLAGNAKGKPDDSRAEGIYGGFDLSSTIIMKNNIIDDNGDWGQSIPVQTYNFGGVGGGGSLNPTTHSQKTSKDGYGDGSGGIMYFLRQKYYKITITDPNATSMKTMFTAEEIDDTPGNNGFDDVPGDIPGTGGGGACFSKETFEKLKSLFLEKNERYILVRYRRGDKKMYRVNYGTYGALEFTFDHPFIYRGRVYIFEELIKVHPIFKKAVPIDDDPTSLIYNIVAHQQQFHPLNRVELGPNLFVVGGMYKTEEAASKHSKVLAMKGSLIPFSSL